MAILIMPSPFKGRCNKNTYFFLIFNFILVYVALQQKKTIKGKDLPIKGYFAACRRITSAYGIRGHSCFTIIYNQKNSIRYRISGASNNPDLISAIFAIRESTNFKGGKIE